MGKIILRGKKEDGNDFSITVDDEESELDLSRNGLKEINFSPLAQCKKLVALDLSGNRLYPLHYSLGNLVNLKVLDIGDTDLSSLPNSIGNLVNLQKAKNAQNRAFFPA